MKKILKYPLAHGYNAIAIPGEGKIRHVGLQRNLTCVWIEVSARKGEAETIVKLHSFWTGQDEFQANNLTYVGTIVGDPLVEHVYQEK